MDSEKTCGNSTYNGTDFIAVPSESFLSTLYIALGMRPVPQDARHRVRGQLGHGLLGPLGTLHARRDSRAQEGQVGTLFSVYSARNCKYLFRRLRESRFLAHSRQPLRYTLCSMHHGYVFQEPRGIKKDIGVVGSDQWGTIGVQPILELPSARQFRRKRISQTGGIRSH